MPRLRARRIAALVLPLALLAASADARMYQWVSPTTGTVQLSGEPPAWYRASEGGPRVRVFENGNLVDDTVIAVPRAQRESLRASAFRESEERQRAEAVKRLERAARREQRRREELARAEQVRQEAQGARAAALAAPPASPAGDESPGSLDDATVDRLKAIISEFDRLGGVAGDSR